MGNQTIIERDNNGNIIKECRYDGENNLLYYHISDWKDGKLTHKSSYDSEGRLTGSFDYAYDEKGNNTEGTWFLSKNGVLMKAEFVYDEDGQVIEKTHYGQGSLATNKTFNTYDEEGKLIFVKYYGIWPDGEVTLTTREYDQEGNLIKSTTKDEVGQILNYEIYISNQFGKFDEYTHYNGDGSILYTIKYYYNDEGNRVKTERYDSEGKLVSTQY